MIIDIRQRAGSREPDPETLPRLEICDLIRQKRLTLNYTGYLLQCPFCGGEAKARYIVAAYFMPAVAIHCQVCNAKTDNHMFMCTSGKDFHETTRQEAITRAVMQWNTRAGAAREHA